MKSLHNAKEARIYASYEAGRKVLREFSVDLPNADAPVNGLFYTKRIDHFHFIVVRLFIHKRYILLVQLGINRCLPKHITAQ